MDYCDGINDIIICVLSDVSDKIKKRLVHSWRCKWHIARVYIKNSWYCSWWDYGQNWASLDVSFCPFFYLSELPSEPTELTPRSSPEPRQPFSQAQTRTNNITWRAGTEKILRTEIFTENFFREEKFFQIFHFSKPTGPIFYSIFDEFSYFHENFVRFFHF